MPLYRSREFELSSDERLLRLRRRGKRLVEQRLSGAAFEVLLALAQRRVQSDPRAQSDPVVSHEELFRRGWPRRRARDEDLYNVISQLRRTLDAPQPREGRTTEHSIIETIDRQGYRLRYPVTVHLLNPDDPELERIYQGLSTPEKEFLCGLRVFAGTWSTDAATAVAAPRENARQVAEMLAAFIGMRLLERNGRGNDARYRMPPSVRDFINRKATDGKMVPPLQELALWLVKLYQQAGKDWQDQDEKTWQARYDPEIDNVPGALEWAFGPYGNIQIGLELGSQTAHQWYLRNNLSERDRWIALMEQHKGSAPPDVYARILLHRASRMPPGDGEALALARQAVELFKIAEDQNGLGFALVMAAYAAFTPDALDAAESYLDEALRVLQKASSLRLRERWLQVSAIVCLERCRYDDAEAAWAEAVTIAKRLGSAKSLFAALSQPSEVHFARGDVAKAIANSRRQLADFDSILGRSWEAAHVRGQLAAYLLIGGHIDEGRHLAVQCLRESRRAGNERSYVWGIERVALAAAETDQAAMACRLLGYADAYHATRGSSREATPKAVVDRLHCLLGGSLSEFDHTRFTDEGSKWSQRQALDEALSSQVAKTTSAK